MKYQAQEATKMTAPEPDQKAPEAAPEAEPKPTEPEQTELPIEPQPEDELPEWAKAKIQKANNEAKNLRNRLKEQEPLVSAAQEAERAKMGEIERRDADIKALNSQLAQRDQELLQARYSIPDEYVEFLLSEGSFEEKEARATQGRRNGAVEERTAGTAPHGSSCGVVEAWCFALHPSSRGPLISRWLGFPARAGVNQKGTSMANECKPLFRPGR
jgi:hypothetical protein